MHQCITHKYVYIGLTWYISIYNSFSVGRCIPIQTSNETWWSICMQIWTIQIFVLIRNLQFNNILCSSTCTQIPHYTGSHMFHRICITGTLVFIQATFLLTFRECHNVSIMYSYFISWIVCNICSSIQYRIIYRRG